MVPFNLYKTVGQRDDKGCLDKSLRLSVFVLWLTVLFGVTLFSDNVFYRSQKNSLDTIPNELTEKKTHETQEAKLEPDPVTPKVIEKPKNITKHVRVKKAIH